MDVCMVRRDRGRLITCKIPNPSLSNGAMAAREVSRMQGSLEADMPAFKVGVASVSEPLPLLPVVVQVLRMMTTGAVWRG